MPASKTAKKSTKTISKTIPKKKIPIKEEEKSSDSEDDIEEEEEVSQEEEEEEEEDDEEEEEENDTEVKPNKKPEIKATNIRDDDEEDKCIYNFASEESEEEMVFDDDVITIESNIVPNDQRRTKPFLFKYERVRLLGNRIQQLTLGAKPMIKNVENYTPQEIAEMELKNNVMPLIIQRPLPNGMKERWYISELQH
jgi:DNA-directed RNA polymerase I, II, and III subunit RPABC2